jgi:hypothetical protein
MWQRPDGGGFGLCEVASAEALYEATAPWSESYLLAATEVSRAVARPE